MKNNTLNFNNRIDALNIIKCILLSVVVILIAIFFISKKANLDIDEFYTYGLSNNAFQLNIENFKEYSGEELLLDYTAAKDGHLFDVDNVFFNQKMDTHPPLYFLLVNFISSIDKNKFSMWYGLSINIFFLIILFWTTRHLLFKLIKDKISATILTLTALTLYGFINNYSFTRMYVMLSAMSLLSVSLIINYVERINKVDNEKTSNHKESVDQTKVSSNIKKRFDYKFLISFYLICVLGILTQYHFMLVAGFFSVILAINLINKKQFAMLFATFASGVLSILTSIIIFPPMISHIFGGANSTHSLSSFSSADSFVEKVSKLFIGLYKAFFGPGIIVYLVLIIIGIIILIASKKLEKKSIKSFIFENHLYFLILLFVIVYFILICCTVKLSFHRYLYNIYPFIFIVVICPIYFIFTSINKYFAFVPILLMCILSVTTTYKNSPTSLNTEDALFSEYLRNNKDTKVILLYRTVDKSLNRNSVNTSLWKLPTPLYVFKDMENMTFVDISNEDALASFSNKTIEGYNDLFLVIYTSEDDQKFINYIMKKNNVSTANRIYFTTYYHVYRLS